MKKLSSETLYIAILTMGFINILHGIIFFCYFSLVARSISESSMHFIVFIGIPAFTPFLQFIFIMAAKHREKTRKVILFLTLCISIITQGVFSPFIKKVFLSWFL